MSIQEKTPSRHFVRRSTTLEKEIFFLLLPCLTLLADGDPTVRVNACFQFCQQSTYLQETGTKFEQICVRVFKLPARVLGDDCESQALC